MYIKIRELKNKEKKFLGSLNSRYESLLPKLREHMKEGYNEIVVTKGKSFHQPETSLWLIKGEKNIDKSYDIYKKAVIDELALYGLSRKSDTLNSIVKNYLERM